MIYLEKFIISKPIFILKHLKSCLRLFSSVYESFEEISSDNKVTQKLQDVYKDVNTIDLWVGGLAEDHLEDSEIGETFHAILIDQFTRLRDGDRFWYANHMTEEVFDLLSFIILTFVR